MSNPGSVSMWAASVACVALLCACTSSAPPAAADKGATGAAAASAAPAASSPYPPSSTFQDVMDSVVAPSADYVWNAVATTVDKKGTHTSAPHTDNDWHEFRRRAVLLVEAANLIAVPGRRVASGDKAVADQQPLDVAKIQQRLDTQHDALVGFAGALRDISQKLVQTADKRDVASITDLGGTLDEVCEDCHKVFWYPEEATPATAPAAQPAATPAK